MRTLIGALLAMTALTPTLASAQDARIGADAGFSRDDRRGPGDDRRGDRRPSRGEDRRVDAPRDRLDGGERRDTPRSPTIRDRRDGDDARNGAGFDRRRFADGNRNDIGRNDIGRDDRWRDRASRRAPDDWTRSRFGEPDGRWRSSRFRAGGDWNRDPDYNGDRNWDRGWRDDRRYDWNRDRAANRGAYRLPRYYAPGGRTAYRHYGIGTGLQASLWARDYWIADPYAYHLPDAYGAFRWVRYYDDALLVDLSSGRVVDAVYGIFW